MAAKVDYLVASVAALSGAQTIKATGWQDAVTQFASGQGVSGRVMCIPAGSVQYAQVQSYPTVQVVAE